MMHFATLPLKLLFLWATIALNACLYGQCLSDASTNPKNPVNNDFLDANGQPLNGHTVNEFKNRLDWGANDGGGFMGIPIYSEGLNWAINVSSVMPSPFSLSGSSAFPYLNQNAALPAELDWHWEDGWELMWMQLGYYPNLENVSTTNPQRVIKTAHILNNPRTPYIILYNRYTGKLRYFGNIWNSSSNYGQIITTLRQILDGNTGTVSGVFRHLNNYDQALDLPTNHLIMSTNSSFPNNENKWFSGEFQLAFDPCTCEKTTMWDMDYYGVNTWSANLYGKLESPVRQLSSEKISNFLNNNGVDGYKNRGGGILIFKGVENMYAEYIKEIEASSLRQSNAAQLENKIFLEILKLAQDLAKNGNSNNLQPSNPTKNYITKSMLTLKPGFDPNNSADMAYGIRTISNQLLGRGFNFLTKQHIASLDISKPDKFTMPSGSFPNMSIKGTVIQKWETRVATFFNPGSFKATRNTLDFYAYPLWNKPVGLFALLKTPHVKFYFSEQQTNTGISYKDYTRNWETAFEPYPAPLQSHGDVFKICNYSYQQEINFKIGDRIWYKFNHNLDFDTATTKILVSLMVVLESEADHDLYFDDSAFGKFQEIDLSNTNLELYQHFSKSPSKNEELTLNTPWLTMEDIQEFNFGGTLQINAHFPVQEGEAIHFLQAGESKYTFNKTHQQIATVENNHIELNSEKVETLKFRVKKVIAKVMPSMNFKTINSKGTVTNTTQVFSYLLFDQDLNIDLIEAKGQWLNQANKKQLAAKYIPHKITLNNDTLTPNSPYVFETIGNKIIVNANEIEILNGLSVIDGYTAELNALKEINIVSGSVGANIEQNIKRNFYDLPKIRETTQNELENFCKGPQKEYTADEATSQSLNQHEIQRQYSSFNASFSPNPATQFFTVNIDNNNGLDYTVSLMDISGKIIFSKTFDGHQNTQKISTTGLAPGIYFIKTSCGSLQKIDKLIIDKQ